MLGLKKNIRRNEITGTRGPRTWYQEGRSRRPRQARTAGPRLGHSASRSRCSLRGGPVSAGRWCATPPALMTARDSWFLCTCIAKAGVARARRGCYCGCWMCVAGNMRWTAMLLLFFALIDWSRLGETRLGVVALAVVCVSRETRVGDNDIYILFFTRGTLQLHRKKK